MHTRYRLSVSSINPHIIQYLSPFATIQYLQDKPVIPRPQVRHRFRHRERHKSSTTMDPFTGRYTEERRGETEARCSGLIPRSQARAGSHLIIQQAPPPATIRPEQTMKRSIIIIQRGWMDKEREEAINTVLYWIRPQNQIPIIHPMQQSHAMQRR